MKNNSTAFILVYFAFIFLFISCNYSTSNNNLISADTAKIAAGATLFDTHCSGCHNFKQNNIGPQLSGITNNVSYDWLQNFIHDPKAVITSGDGHANTLYKQYKTVMPSFAYLKDDEINNIISFLKTHNQTAKSNDDTSGTLHDPVPKHIQSSNLVAQLQLIIQITASDDSNKIPLARITKLDHQPNSDKLFIVDLNGKLYELNNNKINLYMDMVKLKANFINEPGLATGFGSFAFHPQFKTNGLFYTTHTEKTGSAKAGFGYADSIPVKLQWVLTEWKADDPSANIFQGKRREIFRIDMVSGIHGVQEITFNPFAKPGDEDYGLLYIGIGDGGCTENGYAFLAHNKLNPWGTILRIDPSGINSPNGNYGIPSTNPFVKDKNVLGEIYAYGFRNPHRITWTERDEMLCCNIGHANIEAIDLIKKGNDYGWPIREGNFMLHPYGDLNKVYALPANDASFHITYPIAMYDHDEGKAISGGFEYTGNAIPQLKGKFLFGDIPTGRLFYIDVNDIKQGSLATIKEWKVSINGAVKKLPELCGSDRVDLHFGKDAHGELYILTKADGKVYKITAAK